ncbi:MAG: S-methyl-5-thioribose kinase [Geminicoccaceae bacterium]|nr:S-methyl-5-thioribose kinase [Geminicoccaceae bacterium]
MALETPPGYRAFDEASLPGHLAGIEAARAVLGGDPSGWRAFEVGDGNLNLVFIVEGPDGDLCVKQALPYVRLVGESWPLPLSRAFFEHEAASIQARHAPAYVPRLHHYDPTHFLIVMERLRPHVIVRQGMIAGRVYPDFARHMADYAARTLFFTSDLAMRAEEKKAMTATFCGNSALCRITEDLIFTDPYTVSERNRWTSPQLDARAAQIRDDDALKAAASRLKLAFLAEAQALLHGDLHTGSIMATEDETRVIDPEFAFVGPIGFDVGKLIGNLLLSHFAQAGHEAEPRGRDGYRAWILETVEAFWNGFSETFRGLWRENRTGDAFPPSLLQGQAFEAAQGAYMARLFAESLGFAGCSMIRRTLGLAHNADLERIEDPNLRAACEGRVLDLAVALVKNAHALGAIEEVTARARAIEAQGRDRAA